MDKRIPVLTAMARDRWAVDREELRKGAIDRCQALN